MRIITIAALLASLFVAPAEAQIVVDLGADPAREIAAQAAGTPRGQELPVTDARVKQAREWLKQAAAATGETEAKPSTVRVGTRSRVSSQPMRPQRPHV